MRQTRHLLRRAGSTDVPVLVTGETGTGKSTVARILHRLGPRSGKPMVEVNCAGIPEALFESELFGHERGAFTGAVGRRQGLMASAHTGTVFLDEIGELPASQQAKLLTTLDHGAVRPIGGERPRPIDIRVIAATSRRLGEEIRAGTFRADLFHRIAVVRIHLPPLRDRMEDLEPLVAHILAELAGWHDRRLPRISGSGWAFLRRRRWPGNIRELAHHLEAAVVLTGCSKLGEDQLRRALPHPDGKEASIREPDSGSRYSFFGSEEEERERIRASLDQFRGNRTRTAKALGMSRNTLRARIRKYGLD